MLYTFYTTILHSKHNVGDVMNMLTPSPIHTLVAEGAMQGAKFSSGMNSSQFEIQYLVSGYFYMLGIIRQTLGLVNNLKPKLYLYMCHECVLLFLLPEHKIQTI